MDRFNRTVTVPVPDMKKGKNKKNCYYLGKWLNVLLAVTDYPNASIREISRKQEISYVSVQTTITQQEASISHSIKPGITDDFRRRRNFCNPKKNS